MFRNSRMLSLLGCLALFGFAACNQPNKASDGQSAGGLRLHLPDISVVAADEVELVKQVLSHRAEYHRKLRQLRDYYREHGFEMKRRWAEFELDGFEKVRPYAYVNERDVPAEALKPTRQDAGADALYDRGMDLMREGGHGLPIPHRPKVLAEAYKTFVSMIERYPSSDKIDDAAFQCGEILRDHFPGQDAHAVRWYERSLAWDAQTPHPARFRAALLYDFRLDNRERALELYHRIVADGAGDDSNIRVCKGRIEELTAAPPADAEDTAKAQPALFGSPTTSSNRGD